MFFIKALFYLHLGGGLSPLRALCGRGIPRGRSLWRRFLPPFGDYCLWAFRGAPLPSLGRGNFGFFSPVILLRGGVSLFLPTFIFLRESWIRGCSDSRNIPSAGLLDYEDTRLKTSSRVREGLSLAWKASLAIRICEIGRAHV